MNYGDSHTREPFKFMLPKHVLQMEGHSDDFSALHIICSERFMNDLSKFFTKYFPHYIDVSHNPVLPLKEEELDFFVKYYSEIEQTLSDKNNPYRREIIMHQTMLFFYKTSYCYHQYSEKPHKTGNEIFVDNFMDLVRNHYTKHRLLDFYADKLGLTPKYLTTVIKLTSGISATDRIEKFVILEAQALLKSTNLTVQHISDRLNFSSQTFFGKYFKRLTGMSPKSYREMKPNNNSQ